MKTAPTSGQAREILEELYIVADDLLCSGKRELDFGDKTRIDQTLKSLRELVPKKRFVNEQNKSPKPDIINDCEVRREGYNQCRKEMLDKLK